MFGDYETIYQYIKLSIWLIIIIFKLPTWFQRLLSECAKNNSFLCGLCACSNNHVFHSPRIFLNMIEEFAHSGNL